MLHFAPNYSKNLAKIIKSEAIGEFSFNSAQVHVNFYQSEEISANFLSKFAHFSHAGKYILNYVVKSSILKSFAAFISSIHGSCGFNPNANRVPLIFEDPVYGKNEMSFIDFMFPGCQLLYDLTCYVVAT